jgi:lactobin A/cerein 7B family class IIb bacteriocin
MNIGYTTNSIRQLTETELEEVSGGYIPIALGVIAGTIGGITNAHATGSNMWTGGLIGAASGLLSGVGGALWTVSKVASITSSGIGIGMVAAYSYTGGGAGSAGGYYPSARSNASKE